MSKQKRLVAAASRGDIATVRKLLGPRFLGLIQAADVNTKASDGQTGLTAAAANGHSALVEFLLAEGAEVGARTASGDTALILAASWGHTAVVDHLLAQGAEVNVQNEDGNTALRLAAYHGYREIVDSLLAKGAETNVQNNKGDTALIGAAGKSGHTEIVARLLAAGADANVKDVDVVTALIMAAGWGHTEIVRHLLAHGAALNVQDKDGDTALICAADKAGHTEIVAHLLAQGADANVKNNAGNTALMLAASWGHTEIVDRLLAKGAEVDVQNNAGETALGLAANNGHTAVVDRLRAKGAFAPVADLKSLIPKLSLTARELELIHPEKAKAMEDVKKLGMAAVEPLLEALDSADVEARVTMVSLLGSLKDRRAILPIARQLDHSSPQVRFEAVEALAAYPPAEIRKAQVLEYVKRAGSDAQSDVRNRAQEILNRVGLTTPKNSWYSGAVTWEELASAFVRLEVPKPAPDYKGLAEHLQGFSAEEKHAVWIRVAQELKNKRDAIRCYLEALHNDPDPNSVAWGWLSGQYDRDMKILPPNSPKSRATVEALRRQQGAVTD